MRSCPAISFRSAAVLLALFLLLAAAPSLSACPVCFSAKKDSRVAFYVTTAVLTAAPFVLVAAFVIAIRRRMKRQSLNSPLPQDGSRQDLCPSQR